MSQMDSIDRKRYEHQYWLTRFIFLRALGAVYVAAFLSLHQQILPLLGSNGLLPVDLFLKRVHEAVASPYLTAPSIFWLAHSDNALYAASFFGLVLAVMLLLGVSNGLLLALLWGIYLSLVNVGQIFYGYGWETLLLETGFLAIFLVPFLNIDLFPARYPPSVALHWLLRWLAFRIMFGAGMIKMRAAETCWKDLSCMTCHYETQPLPNPLSWYFHQLPLSVHQVGTMFNHAIELFIPWLFFAPRAWRQGAAAFTIFFQLLLILSGNLSWLNWITITVCLGLFDDRAWSHLAPRSVMERVSRYYGAAPRRLQRLKVGIYVTAVLALSIQPVGNLLSSKQLMNASFDPLHIVNTYGAFGSVGKIRNEIILEGTTDSVITSETVWRPYEFKCKPGDIDRRPCVVAPYQLRLDWQIWFAAMQRLETNPWLIHLVAKLLAGDKSVMPLLDGDPFPDGKPKWIRAELYRYRFTPPDGRSPNPNEQVGKWWARERIRPYFGPLSLENAGLRRYLEQMGWYERLAPKRGQTPLRDI